MTEYVFGYVELKLVIYYFQINILSCLNYILLVTMIEPSLQLSYYIYQRIRKIILIYNLSVNRLINLFILSLIKTIYYIFLNGIIVKSSKLVYKNIND